MDTNRHEWERESCSLVLLSTKVLAGCAPSTARPGSTTDATTKRSHIMRTQNNLSKRSRWSGWRWRQEQGYRGTFNRSSNGWISIRPGNPTVRARWYQPIHRQQMQSLPREHGCVTLAWE